MTDQVLKRRAFLATANLAVLAGTTDAMAALQTDDKYSTARGTPGTQVSTQDYVDILQLYARYCHAIDTGNPEALADTYSSDGTFVYGRGPGKGKDVRTPIGGRDFFLKVGTGGGSRHFTTNLVVNKTREGADASCYLLLYDVTVLPPVFVETALYDDKLVKTPKGWRFKSRTVWRDDDDITPFKPKPGAGKR